LRVQEEGMDCLELMADLVRRESVVIKVTEEPQEMHLREPLDPQVNQEKEAPKV